MSKIFPKSANALPLQIVIFLFLLGGAAQLGVFGTFLAAGWLGFTPKEAASIGIIGALALAAARVLNATGVRPDLVLLDGKHDWISRVAPGSQVVTRIQADATCAAVAAASIIAKEHRDRLMRSYDAVHPGYGWATNKGYGSAVHLEALRRLGPTPLHRTSFSPVAQLILL